MTKAGFLVSVTEFFFADSTLVPIKGQLPPEDLTETEKEIEHVQ